MLLHSREKGPWSPALVAALLAALIWPGRALTALEDPGALLDRAEAAERTGHLVYPARGSAMSLYHEALSADPGNEHALAGLTRIAEHYLEAAQQAMDRHALIKADSLLSRARMVYPDYPGIEAIAGQLALLEGAERTLETLDWRAVAARSPSLKPRLHRLGSAAKQGDCRVTISVSNDAEGRWIYRQLSDAPGKGRIRAEVQIASPAAVEILCFDDA